MPQWLSLTDAEDLVAQHVAAEVQKEEENPQNGQSEDDLMANDLCKVPNIIVSESGKREMELELDLDCWKVALLCPQYQSSHAMIRFLTKNSSDFWQRTPQIALCTLIVSSSATRCISYTSHQNLSLAKIETEEKILIRQLFDSYSRIALHFDPYLKN